VILRLLNGQGIAGIGASLALAFVLLLQRGETAHWRKQSLGFELSYRKEQAAYASSVASIRAAADSARAADRAIAARVAAAQRAINERTEHDHEARLAAARAAAERLRVGAAATADPGARADPSMPGVPLAARSLAQATGQDRLSDWDALTATEQAIQLDELIKWVRAQAKVDNNASAVASLLSDNRR